MPYAKYFKHFFFRCTFTTPNEPHQKKHELNSLSNPNHNDANHYDMITNNAPLVSLLTARIHLINARLSPSLPAAKYFFVAHKICYDGPNTYETQPEWQKKKKRKRCSAVRSLKGHARKVRGKRAYTYKQQHHEKSQRIDTKTHLVWWRVDGEWNFVKKGNAQRTSKKGASYSFLECFLFFSSSCPPKNHE